MYFKEAMNGAYKALDKLKSEKVIKAIGVGLNESDMCVRFAEAGDFDCMILAGRFTLLEQGALDVFFPLAFLLSNGKFCRYRSIVNYNA